MHLVWGGDWIRKLDSDFKFPIVNQWTQSCIPLESSSSKRDKNPVSKCYQPVHVCKMSINIYEYKVYLTNEERIVDCRELDIETMNTLSLWTSLLEIRSEINAEIQRFQTSKKTE